jgi:anti-sigma B factor antagonist
MENARMRTGTAMERFSVSVEERSPARFVVTVAGELDLSQAEDLGTRLEALIKPGTVVALDAAALTFMDSTGLRVLLQATAHAAARAAGFRLVSPQPAVIRVLELSGTMNVVDLREDLAAALAD